METSADASMVTNVDNDTDVEVAVFVTFLENDLKCPSENDAYRESDVSLNCKFKRNPWH